MIPPKFSGTLAAIAGLVCCLFACNDGGKKETGVTPPKDTVVSQEPAAEVKRPPIINIGDTLSVKRIVLTVKDSAASIERVNIKLSEIYDVTLADFIKKNKLKITGRPMAWYKSPEPPFFFEAGIPVDKRPAKLPAGIKIKETGIDSIVVAHFYGPYELLSQGYTVLEDLLKDRKKKLKGQPYEIYVDDPVDSNGLPKNPYKVLTEIVFPYK